MNIKNVLGGVMIILCSFTTLIAQWSDVVQITKGDFNDEMPMFASYLPIYGPTPYVDYLVFTRKDSVGSNICLKKTIEYGRKWDEKVTYITSDSFVNKSPSIARRLGYPSYELNMIVWQSNRSGNNDIYYSVGDGVNWSTPSAITTSRANDINPSVGLNGTTFIVVWVSNGRIKSSIFSDNRWSDAMNVSDSNFNSSPKITSNLWGPSVVFWDKMFGDSVQILYSIFNNNTWSVPILFKTIDDKSNLEITKIFGNIQVTWNQKIGDDYEVYGRISEHYFDTLRWGRESNISNNPLAHNKNASSIHMPVIWKEPQDYLYFDVIAFEDSSATDNCIRARSIYTYEDEIFNTKGIDKNPVVSCGVPDTQNWPNPYNVWVVWQTNESGKWHLVGSYFPITAWGVEEEMSPNFFQLNQNYPNPFNPNTTISFYLSNPTKVSLEIYNTLGVRVRTYLEENRSIGEHKIVWDGRDDKGVVLSSGVYYYRLITDKSAQTRKMILIR